MKFNKLWLFVVLTLCINSAFSLVQFRIFNNSGGDIGIVTGETNCVSGFPKVTHAIPQRGSIDYNFNEKSDCYDGMLNATVWRSGQAIAFLKYRSWRGVINFYRDLSVTPNTDSIPIFSEKCGDRRLCVVTIGNVE